MNNENEFIEFTGTSRGSRGVPRRLEAFVNNSQEQDIILEDIYSYNLRRALHKVLKLECPVAEVFDVLREKGWRFYSHDGKISSKTWKVVKPVQQQTQEAQQTQQTQQTQQAQQTQTAQKRKK